MAKQLSLPERYVIERMLHQDYSFASIGRNLDRSPIPPDEVILSPKLIKH